MTRQEAMREACEIVALAYHSIGDYTLPSDGFCDKCPAAAHALWHYQNSGEALQWVREAVLQRLRHEGIRVAAGFDPLTGRAS